MRPSYQPIAGPSQVTSDGKFLVSRTGTVVNLIRGDQGGDLKPVMRIDPYLALSVDVESGSAYLLRPDGYVAARFHRPTRDMLETALARASGER